MDWSYVAGYFDGEGTVRLNEVPSRPGYLLTGLSWANTHLESLEAIRDFISCGTIRPKARREHYRPGYELVVNRADDVLRVGEQMLPHLIIKRARLKEMLEFVHGHRKPQPKAWG